MRCYSDVLGDEGRKVLESCVKVKIYGRQENLKKYVWEKALGRLRTCYVGQLPGGWLPYQHISYSLLTTEFDEYGSPNKEKLYDIIDIHDALVAFDKLPYVEKYPNPGPRYDEMKALIDERRADVERECKEAADNPDKLLCQYSWLVAQRRVKDCFAGSFAGDAGLLELKPEHTPNEPYSIIEIHDAVELQHRQIYLEGEGPGCADLNKSVKACRLGVKEEYQEAKHGLHTYSKRKAEQKVQNCFPTSGSQVHCRADSHLEVDAAIDPNSKQMYDIFDIHTVLLHLDQEEDHNTVRTLKKDYELTESDKAALAERDAISKEYQNAKERLYTYSRNEAERRVRDCFAGTHPCDTDIFPSKETKDGIPKTQQTYNIFEIKNAVHYFEEKKFLDRHLADEELASKCKNERVDKDRAEIEEEYADATKKIEIEHGSGFIIHDHLIITNKHVIEDAFNDKTVGDKSELQGGSHNEAEQKVNVVNDITNENDDRKEIFISNVAIEELPCEIIHQDARKDLALLYCRGLNSRGNGICPLQLSNHSLSPGMQIFSFGYPMSHKGNSAVFVNGYVSGSEETFNDLCSSGHKMAVLNCSLNHGNSGGPVLCWVKGQLKVVGIATQKHFKEILTLEEREKIEKIRDSLQTSAITNVSDEAIQHASSVRERSNEFCPSPDPCQTPMFLLTLKLYDALETHSQFNLSNAVPGHCMVEFVEELRKTYKGEGREELREVVRWSEDRDNVLPSGNHSAFECCCVQ